MKTLKHKREFAEVRLHGKKINSCLGRVFLQGNNELVAGIVVSGKVGNAVLRNKIRRRIKAALQNIEKIGFVMGKIVIVVRPEVVRLSYKEMLAEAKRLFGVNI